MESPSAFEWSQTTLVSVLSGLKPWSSIQGWTSLCLSKCCNWFRRFTTESNSLNREFMTFRRALQGVQNSLSSTSFASSPSLGRIWNTLRHMWNGLFRNLSLLMATLLLSVAQFVPIYGKRLITPTWTILCIFFFFLSWLQCFTDQERAISPPCHPEYICLVFRCSWWPPTQVFDGGQATWSACSIHCSSKSFLICSMVILTWM